MVRPVKHLFFYSGEGVVLINLSAAQYLVVVYLLFLFQTLNRRSTGVSDLLAVCLSVIVLKLKLFIFIVRVLVFWIGR